MYKILLGLIVCVSGEGFATSLEVGKPVEREIRKDSKEVFEIELKKGDYAAVEIEPRQILYDVLVNDHAGQKLLVFDSRTETMTLGIPADASGKYSVIISTRGSPTDGAFKIRIKQKLNPRQRTQFLKEDDEISAVSPTVAKLMSGSIPSQFWKDLKAKGTPLIEPFPGDPKKRLVTFFWRGDSETQNVVVLIWPYARWQVDDYKMSRIGRSDIWYKTLALRSDLRILYSLAPNAPARISANNVNRLFDVNQSDPLNPKTFTYHPEDPSPTKYQRDSILEMPDAPAQPWIQRRENIARGQIENRVFKSELLKNEREVTIYKPHGHKENGKYDLLIVFDREDYLVNVPTPVILDNLIADKKIAPTVAVLVDFPVPKGEMRSKELTCNPAFSEMLKKELLPWARKNFGANTEADQVFLAGSSFGGLASTCAGLHHPETFQNILSQSGSYWWTKAFGDKRLRAGPNDEPNDVARIFLKSKKLPLKFYMEAGLHEIDLTGKGDDLLLTNRNLRNILLAKGYDVDYREFAGGHDYLTWRESLAEGLMSLYRRK